MAAMALFGTQAQAAECAVDTIGGSTGVFLWNNVPCDATAPGYNFIEASNSGTVVNVLNPVTIDNQESMYAVAAYGGSVIDFKSRATLSAAVGSAVSVENGTVNFTDADITAVGVGISARGTATTGIVNATGHVNIKITGSASYSFLRNAGITADRDSKVILNSATIDTTGDYSVGVRTYWWDNASVTASGKTDISTAGLYADGVFQDGLGHVALSGGGTIHTKGANAAAIRVTNRNGTANTDHIPLFIAPNTVSLTGHTLIAEQANVIETNAGSAIITLKDVTATAATGQRFLNVDDGTALKATGFRNAIKPSVLILNADHSTLTGDALVADDGSTADLFFTNGTVYTGKMDNVTNLDMDASSTWKMTADSNTSQNVNNVGTIYWQHLGNTLTVNGNYTGTAGSVLSIETQLGDDASPTDKMHVVGDTSGTSQLIVRNAGGTGALTDKGIPVIIVEGASNGTFTMAAPVQAGSYEYTLNQGGKNADAKNWYLNSEIIPTCANTPALCPVDPVKPIYIYRPAVANYVTAQSANADAGFTLLSTLHQRMGEQRGASTGLTTEKAQTWGRIFAGTKEADGKNRFNYDSTISGFQFGRDLMHKTDANGTQQRAGVTVQYANNSIDSVDTMRPLAGLNADTGHTNAVSVGLGGYYTHIANDGTYFDGVAQINHLRNSFHDAYDMGSTQKGWQFGLSGEVGKTVAHIGNWAVEPQAQLSYLYNNYSSFSDKYSHIDGFGAHNLRARLGVRLNKDEMVNGKEAQYYGIVNVHHDLLKTKAVVLHDNNGTGTASVKERFDRTSWELGAGIQGRVGKATYLYADARYERSFKGNTSAAKVTMGVKSSF